MVFFNIPDFQKIHCIMMADFKVEQHPAIIEAIQPPTNTHGDITIANNSKIFWSLKNASQIVAYSQLFNE